MLKLGPTYFEIQVIEGEQSQGHSNLKAQPSSSYFSLLYLPIISIHLSQSQAYGYMTPVLGSTQMPTHKTC